MEVFTSVAIQQCCIHHKLTKESKTALHRTYLMNFFKELPKGSHSPLTTYLALSGTSMSSKNPERDFKRKSLYRVQEV